jgi:hypothetical protein
VRNDRLQPTPERSRYEPTEAAPVNSFLTPRSPCPDRGPDVGTATDADLSSYARYDPGSRYGPASAPVFTAATIDCPP